MNEWEVVVYLQTAFETHKFTVNREAHISHVISFDILLFNVDVAGLMGGIKKWATSLARERTIQQVWPVYDFAGFHCHAIENKIPNHSIN